MMLNKRTVGEGGAMNLQALIATAPSWLSGEDDTAGIVISCRARLARNVTSYPFGAKITEDEQAQVVASVLAAAKGCKHMSSATFYNMELLDKNERRLLVERHLISPNLADAKGQRGVLFNSDESLSVMINEEDHLRIQAISPGLQVAGAWGKANALDDELALNLECSYSDDLGFLTACPTNTGTGLRLSVLMHLPALVLTEDMERVLQGLTQMSFTVRGVYGEGTNAAGNLFQVSNQSTLGQSEQDIVEGLLGVAGKLVDYERDGQETLLGEARAQVEDKVWRALGLLSSARVLSSQEFMNLLSAVRLGLSLSLIRSLPSRFVNQLMIVTQPAHLQAEAGQRLEPDERDFRRAMIVRRKLEEADAHGEERSA